MENTKVKFLQWECDVEFAKYKNGQAAILLTHPEDGPIATATTCIERTLEPMQKFEGYTWIKTWEKNEGILSALLEANVIELTGYKYDVNSFGSTAVLVKIKNYEYPTK